MKIWIDFINTPQVTFFVPFLSEFRKDGHEILLTCRDSGNTVDLLNQYGLQYTIIGAKAGKGLIQKTIFFPMRLMKLLFFIRKEKPDIAASQSSFYQPLVAWMLGIPSLYTNDNEHARGNIFGFIFAQKVVLPVALKNMDFTRRLPLRNKLSFYPSVKEAIYLSQNRELQLSAKGMKSKIYFRPEPWSAQYYDGPLNFFDDILLKLALRYEVVVLPRDKNQSVHYTQEKFAGVTCLKKPIGLSQIVTDCLLFIGAGGSMTREMAVLEVPVISIYQSDLLSVDRYLIDKGVMKINPSITYDEIISHLDSVHINGKVWSVLNQGKISYEILKNLIYNLKYE